MQALPEKRPTRQGRTLPDEPGFQESTEDCDGFSTSVFVITPALQCRPRLDTRIGVSPEPCSTPLFAVVTNRNLIPCRICGAVMAEVGERFKRLLTPERQRFCATQLNLIQVARRRCGTASFFTVSISVRRA